MATIEKRTDNTGRLHYRVKIRQRGYKPISQTFARLTDARQFARATEGDIAAGRPLVHIESRRHLLMDVIDRYCQTRLLHKAPNTIRSQSQQLKW